MSPKNTSVTLSLSAAHYGIWERIAAAEGIPRAEVARFRIGRALAIHRASRSGQPQPTSRAVFVGAFGQWMQEGPTAHPCKVCVRITDALAAAIRADHDDAPKPARASLSAWASALFAGWLETQRNTVEEPKS